MTTLLHLSDPHLSGRRAFFADNFQSLCALAGGLGAELAVSTGDLTIDGADDLDDLQFARACHERLGLAWKAIPGNHDVGEEPGGGKAGQPTTPERLERYRSVFGADWWSLETAGRWRLFGLDCLVFGTGLDAEAAQWAWLEETVAACTAAHFGLFIHKPFWVEGPDEPENPEWTVSPAARARLMAALGERLRFVASGHLHQGRARTYRGVRHIWAPSIGFPSTNLRTADCDTRVGFALITLGEDGGVHARTVHPEHLSQHDYRAILENGLYPSLRHAPERRPPAAWP